MFILSLEVLLLLTNIVTVRDWVKFSNDSLNGNVYRNIFDVYITVITQPDQDRKAY